jgi:hypothetical protein
MAMFYSYYNGLIFGEILGYAIWLALAVLFFFFVLGFAPIVLGSLLYASFSARSFSAPSALVIAALQRNN